MATANALKQTTDLINNIFEEDENNDRKVDGRSQPRPGKSYLHVTKDYCNSTWGRMLLDDKDQLMKKAHLSTISALDIIMKNNVVLKCDSAF